MIFEQRKHPLAELAELLLFKLRPRPLQRFFKAFIVKWLEQVIERVELKRPYRILVVGRHKNDDRQLICSNLFQHPEAVEVGHLDIEEDEVGRVSPDRAQRFAAVRAFADDRELNSAAQQIADAPSRQNLVINDQRAYGFHHLIFAPGAFPVRLSKRNRQLDGQSALVSVLDLYPMIAAVELLQS